MTSSPSSTPTGWLAPWSGCPPTGRCWACPANRYLAAGLGTSVGDIGCGTGRLEPYLAARGLCPCGTDLSPEMIRVARRDYPGFGFDIAVALFSNAVGSRAF